jgi:hypothetical protein
MRLASELRTLRHAERNLAGAFREVGRAHAGEVDVFHLAPTLAAQCDAHVERLAPFVESDGDEPVPFAGLREADLGADESPAYRFTGPRDGDLGLLHDLEDLYLLASLCDITWTLVGQAARGARDQELSEVVERSAGETAQQLQWLRTRLQQAAPQTLVVA